MRDDPYILNSCKNNQINPKKDYHSPWNKFFNAIKRIEKNRDMIPSEQTKTILLDVNCWLAMFYGYEYKQNKTDKRLGYMVLQDIDNAVSDALFKHNVKRLFTVFYFDLKSFYEVWTYQQNIERLLNQIIQEQFFLGNRFAKKKQRPWKPKNELICYPSRHGLLKMPTLNRILDGLLFPVIVSKNHRDYRIERLETTNFGEGDFITCGGQVIDCIRVNDFWQTRNHLKQRLAFSFLVETDYDEAPMIICNNMKDIKNAWVLLGANREDGILIRSLGENLYENYWLILNKNSAFVAMYTKSGFSMNKGGRNKRGFVTLEGRHIGTLDYTYTALKQMNWLDKFDIERFYEIVFQDNKISICGDVLAENNKYDMTPEFDYDLFDLKEIEKGLNDYDWNDDLD